MTQVKTTLCYEVSPDGVELVIRNRQTNVVLYRFPVRDDEAASILINAVTAYRQRKNKETSHD